MKVLVCGGAGYIGSHTCVELIEAGHDVVVFDNFSNASRVALQRVERITGRDLAVVEGDIRDHAELRHIFAARAIDAVIHFAALKSVGESWEKPLDYFENNISGTVTLLQAMVDAGVRRLVFSSSATVYGVPDQCPITESAPLRVTNPYGRTKLVAEQLIDDLCASDPRFKAGILRYFNPVGAHESGLIGEDPAGTPNNLMPYVCQVAVGKRPHLQVFGKDYPTSDGTGVRDYIHVIDLARAHVKALEYMAASGQCLTVNLGTGKGYSVLEVVAAFEKASGRPVPVKFCDRRPGDVAECYASPKLASRLIGWTAEHDLQRMCQDAWRWQSSWPNGYVA